MLVLSRKVGESVLIGVNGEIRVTIKDLDRGKVRIGVEAPREVLVLRKELLDGAEERKE